MNGPDANVFGVVQSALGQPWRWRSPESRAFQSATVVERLCIARGIAREDHDRWLKPTLRDGLPDPALFQDMERAAERICVALRKREQIAIFGDYDVDGATSAALLIRFFRMLGHDVHAYIPDRFREGYGPSAAAMQTLAQGGARLVITVDCGIQSFEALDAAKAAGLEVIVVDHHQAASRLPAAAAVVNPNRLDESDGAAAFRHLAAVGVAFLLAVATNRQLRNSGGHEGREPDLLSLLDIVALGTVADVVPLTGLNRAFVAQGLKVMARRQNAGLAALIDAAGLDRAPTCGDLGFHLGPRINAGGRVGRSDLGVRLLTTDDPQLAAELASELDQLNQERRAIEADVLEQATAACASAEPILVVAGEGWHQGVIGIVAGRLKERMHRPVIVIGHDGVVGKGSGRSVPGVDLGAAILSAHADGIIDGGGGHAMAAGLTVRCSEIDRLRSYLRDRLASAVERASDGKAMMLDDAFAPAGLTLDVAEELKGAGPYGMGWPAPRVAIGPVQVVKCDIVGSDHVRAILAGRDGGRMKAMAFRHADTPLGQLLAGAGARPIYVAGRVEIDAWGSAPKPELHLEDAALA